VTTARSTSTVHDGSGSLSCEKIVTGGVFQSLRVTDNVTGTHDESAGGYDYACWVWCPAGETGWFAQEARQAAWDVNATRMPPVPVLPPAAGMR